VAAKHEERRLHAARGEGVEHQGRRVGIGAVVERQGDGAVIRRQARDRASENRTVAIEGTVGGAAQQHGADA
jgi:hypothetical protein